MKKNKFWLALFSLVLSLTFVGFINNNSHVEAASYGRVRKVTIPKKFRGTWYLRNGNSQHARIKKMVITKNKIGKYTLYKQRAGYKMPNTARARRATRNWRKAYWKQPKTMDIKVLYFENWEGSAKSRYRLSDELVQDYHGDKPFYVKGITISRDNKVGYITLFHTKKQAKDYTIFSKGYSLPGILR